MRRGLVLAIIIASLVVAGVSTAIIKPGPLASHDSCYGTCPSVTHITVTPANVVFGDEEAATFHVQVSSGSTATSRTPEGTVTVDAGNTPLCQLRLADGKGSCHPSPSILRAGPYGIRALYAGNAVFSGSKSGTRPLGVVKATTVTHLQVSRSIITYGSGHLRHEVFSVDVTPQYPGAPAGTVMVTTRTRILCEWVFLTDRHGSCTLSPGGLSVGVHEIEATFTGDRDFRPSTSTPKEVTVVPG